MELDASDSLSARKRQKVDEIAVNNTNSAKKDWFGGSRNVAGDSTYGGKHVNPPGFARRDSYNKDDNPNSSGYGYPTDSAYDRTRGAYSRDYPGYAAENANWKQQRGSSWYDDYPSAGSAYGASTQWNADSRYRDYPTHNSDPYAASSGGFYRSNSGKADGYGYDGYYRSSSAERGEAYPGDRSTAVPSSSSNAYYGADGYSAARYDYPQDGYGARYDGQAYGADTGGGAGRFGKGGRFGFSSAYRAENAANNSAAGGRYANTFKARQYSFGNKKFNKARQNTAGSPNKRRVAGKEGEEEAQQEQKEPEKPKIIDDPAVKDYLSLRSTLLDYHLTMALLKLNLKPDLDMRKTLLDQKMAEAGLFVPPEVVPEPVAAAPAAVAGTAAQAMPAPVQLSRVNSVEVVKQKSAVAGGASLTRAESAGPGVLKRDVSGVKRQNTWNVAVPVSNWDADTMSVSSAMSGKEEAKSEYGSASKPGFSARQGRDAHTLPPDLSAYGPAGAASDSQQDRDSAWKPPARSRDSSALYGPDPAVAAAVVDVQRDVRGASRERSAPRSRSHSRLPPAAYSRDSSAAYAGRDSRDRMAARGHSRDNRATRDTRDVRDNYDYPSGYNYDYNAAYSAADRYPDDRYGYDAYAYGGYDDRGYGAAAYPAYDRYDQYPQGRADTRDRADYGYDARGAYGAAPVSHSAGRYGDRRDGAVGGAGVGADAGRGRGRSSARTDGLVRQGSASNMQSHRSRSRSPHGASAVDAGGRPSRGVGADSSAKADRVTDRDAPPTVRSNSNSRGSIAQSASSGQLQASGSANSEAAAAAQRAVSPAQEREPGESSPISTPEAPQGKRFHREVILAKPQGQPAFNKGYGKNDFSGGGAQGNMGKQGHYHHQGQGQGHYGPGQQGQFDYAGGQQGAQQGGPPFNKHQNKFHKNNHGGPAQQQQQQQGGQARPKPSPKKPVAAAAATSPAPVAVTEVAPLKTPR